MTQEAKPLLPRYATLLFLLAIALTACTANTSGSATAPSPLTATPSAATASPEEVAAREAWARGPHADTYALEKGPNTYCARCHSPDNWDVNATIDPPPDCVSCKFSFEDEPRVAAGNPLVPEDEWQSIGCDVCHRVENGTVNQEIGWRDRSSGYYEALANSTILCQKCHLDNETLAHARYVGPAHADFTCTNCHDAHDTTASCGDCHDVRLSGEPRFIPEHEDVTGNEQCPACHNGVWQNHPMQVQQSANDNCMHCHGALMGQTTIPAVQIGHSGYHAAVTCFACHDAVGLKVLPVEDGGTWITFRTTELLGSARQEPYQSHSLQAAVDCRRCHYRNNPWGLTADITESSHE